MADKKDQIIWLSGGYHSRRDAMKKIRSQLDGYDYFVCDNTKKPHELIGEIKSIGCFSDGKLINVVGMPNIDTPNGKKKLLNDLKNAFEVLPDNVIIVFNGINESKEKGLYKLMKSEARMLEFPLKLSSREVESYINHKASEFELIIDNDAMRFIIDHCIYDSGIDGYSADLVDMTLRKLGNYCNSSVSKEDVIATANDAEKIVSWDFMDALDQKDSDRCFYLLNKMIVDAGSVREAIIPLVQLLIWRYRLVFFVKELLSQGLSKEEAKNIAMNMGKLSSSGSGMSMKMTKNGEQKAWSPGAIRMVVDGGYGNAAVVDRLSRRDVFRIMNCLQYLTPNMRLHTSEEFQKLLVDVFVLTTCEKIDDKSSERIKKSMELENTLYAR